MNFGRINPNSPEFSVEVVDCTMMNGLSLSAMPHEPVRVTMATVKPSRECLDSNMALSNL